MIADCKPDCLYCIQMAWAAANVAEREGMGNVNLDEDCEDCDYCQDRESSCTVDGGI